MPKNRKPDDSQQLLPLDGDRASKAPSPTSESRTDAPSKAPAPSPEQAQTPPPPPASDTSAVSNEGAPLAHQFRNWFLDYSSYVILDRAVPHLDDGLKPVQRRILQTMYEMEDGRFHKVANIVGATMRLHPHGDASINETLVNLGQKNLLVETQGNFGNSLTGDGAAAPRYIEARLSRFALDVAFNPKLTEYQPSYDGRTREPVTLPMKFPLLLAQGAEGIAVGLSVKILPHNLADLLHAAIQHLQGKRFRLLPDFPTGGIADFSAYNDGQRGGRVKVRARIEKRAKHLLAITEIPWGTTTLSLIESITAAVQKGKIKIRNVTDNTADKVEILLHLPQGADPDRTIDQLYVFTDCEVSHAPISCVIDGDKPAFLGVSEILRRSVERTRDLLRRELEIRRAELEDQWHAESLERIFIEERIYRRIEKAERWEEVLAEIRAGLEPFADRLRRPITDDDITRLTEIRIKRISRYDARRAEERLAAIEREAREVAHNLRHLTAYAIAWFEQLRDKHAKGLKRRTSHSEIETIAAHEVVVPNRKLLVDRANGFAGWGLRGEGSEQIAECSELDDVIGFTADGTMRVCRVGEKVFLGANLLHAALFPREGDTKVYTLVYQDKESGKAFAKRFRVGGVTRDKVYLLVPSEGSRVLFLDVASDETPFQLLVTLSGRCNARVKEFTFDLAGVSISHRGARGVTVTKWPVKSVCRS